MGSSSSPSSRTNAGSGSGSMTTTTTTPQFRVGTATTSPEFVAVILAATHGANLFPLTAAPAAWCNSSSTAATSPPSTATSAADASSLVLVSPPLMLLPPKHLLPLAGVSLLNRLIACLQQSGGFSDIVVCIAQDDHVTIPSLLVSWKVVGGHSSNSDRAAKTSDLDIDNNVAAASPVVILHHQEVDTTKDSNANPGSFWNTTTVQPQQPRLLIVRLPVGSSSSSDHTHTSAGGGSVDALRHVEAVRVISKHSHIVVFPSDLVILHGTTAIQQLVHAHRQRQPQQQQQQQQHEPYSGSSNIDSSGYTSHSISCNILSPSAACTVLLADVGEEDENGIPLKESAKQKKGGLAREDEAIEYTALAYDSNNNNNNNSTHTTPRLIWKQSKFDVESDEHFTGDTPKLVLPKPRLRLGATAVKVQTNWNDLHVYVLSPWVRRLLVTRTSLLSIQHDLIPLLIARQTKGICATFGSKMDKVKVHEILRSNTDSRNNNHDDDDDSTHSPHSSHPMASSNGLSKVPRATSSSSSEGKQGDVMAGVVPRWLTSQYAVLAHVIPGAAAVRANSIPAFLHASKELVTQLITVSSGASGATNTTPTQCAANPCLFVPHNSTIRAKSQSVILPETAHDMLGDKITFKSTIVGRYCKVGHKCRLNNVILFDNVTLGDNCIIQNTIIGPSAVIGDNCSLNDCQVAPSKVVASGTKHKGEALLLDDDGDHHDHNHGDSHGDDCFSKLQGLKI
jgi:hypothetical protein